MVIDRIELTHYRNYEKLIMEPHPGVNIFFGQNGSGKTNLLEAIHYCSLGKSHRISQDQNAVMMGKDGASCRLFLREGEFRKEIVVKLQPGEEFAKSVWIDHKKIGRLSEMMGVLRCVIFSPEDLGLVRDGPSVRRRYLDMMISQISRPYFIALQQYRSAMNQRNAILKQAKISFSRPDDMIEDFEASMTEYAEQICSARVRYIEQISESVQQIYRQISGIKDEAFKIRYHASVPWQQGTGFPMAEMLKNNREEDVRQGITGIGPQRDDLILTLNGKNMKLYASQGQTRTGALSLKLAQLYLIQQVTGDRPVLLLDDVMSELDIRRRMNLLSEIEGVQTFITCSDEGDLEAWQNYRTYEVFTQGGNGQVSVVKEGPDIQKQILREPVFE